MPSSTNPLIVQGDKSLLLEVQNERYEAARDALARFAELEKSPEYIHTYRITPLSLWNAASAGLSAAEIIVLLEEFSKYGLPSNVARDIDEYVGRYGRVKLVREGDNLILISADTTLMVEILNQKTTARFIRAQLDEHRALVDPGRRGHLKQALLQIGYPAEDLAGYVVGEDLPITLRPVTRSGEPFQLRHYQEDAAEVFHAGGTMQGGSGVIVLPCGAGKTIVGMVAMAQLQTSTLILTPHTVAVRQWMSELVDKTSLTEDVVGEYSGLQKDIRPVTVSTYQILTYRKRSSDEFPHFGLFSARNWGLIIYDEVHLLPAPVFRITAEIQARRRLGLTATLVREDGLEGDVFSLIGPQKYNVPWKDLEKQGWIATAICHEIRAPLDESLRMEYALAPQRQKYSIAAHNPRKLPILQAILKRHAGESILVIGMYLDQLETIAKQLETPLITGATPVREREKLYAGLRSGEIQTLVVSKVANFSIDLPDASVAIEISGTFGSRQEEAQRLGRILRPKSSGVMAHFYSIVTRETVDQTFAANRQRFLTEQGYKYEILYENELL
ncbi:MAG: DEAD/DEAH box helicase [Anaerolineales bacterium]|nr:DEAD/DEAH box helicase [Anaerolineales bacterium]